MPFCLEPARVEGRMHRQISVISIDCIRGGGHTTAPQDELEELMRSIRRLGLLAPLLVRPRGEGYELIAGARRLAACRALGMSEVECIVMPALDEECLLAALAENACRAAPSAAAVEAMRRALSVRHGYTRAELDALCPPPGRGGDAAGQGAQAGCDAPRRGESAGRSAQAMRDVPGRGESAERAVPGRGEPAERDAPRQRASAERGAARTESPRAGDDVRAAPRAQYAAPPERPPEDGRAPTGAIRRGTHGYIRDERLIVNTMADVVDELRRAGVEASFDVGEAAGRVDVRVSFPHIEPRKGKISSAAEGEHSVEFTKNIGKCARKTPLKIENQQGHSAGTALELSEIGRELREIGSLTIDKTTADGDGDGTRKQESVQPPAAEEVGDMHYLPRRMARKSVPQEAFASLPASSGERACACGGEEHGGSAAGGAAQPSSCVRGMRAAGEGDARDAARGGAGAHAGQTAFAMSMSGLRAARGRIPGAAGGTANAPAEVAVSDGPGAPQDAALSGAGACASQPQSEAPIPKPRTARSHVLSNADSAANAPAEASASDVTNALNDATTASAGTPASPTSSAEPVPKPRAARSRTPGAAGGTANISVAIAEPDVPGAAQDATTASAGTPASPTSSAEPVPKSRTAQSRTPGAADSAANAPAGASASDMPSAPQDATTPNADAVPAVTPAPGQPTSSARPVRAPADRVEAAPSSRRMSAEEYVEHLLREEQARLRHSDILT